MHVHPLSVYFWTKHSSYRLNGIEPNLYPSHRICKMKMDLINEVSISVTANFIICSKYANIHCSPRFSCLLCIFNCMHTENMENHSWIWLKQTEKRQTRNMNRSRPFFFVFFCFVWCLISTTKHFDYRVQMYSNLQCSTF